MRKKSAGKLCVLCGHAMATTKEHIPPRGVIPDAWRRDMKSNYLTVPACSKCNNGTSDDDAAFKVYVGAHCQFDAHDDAERENLIKTLIADNRLFEQFFIHSRKVYVQPPGSGVMQSAWRIPVSRGVVRRVTKKICKGLHFHEFGEVVTAGHYDVRDFSLNDRSELAAAYSTADQAGLVVRGELLDGRLNYATFALEDERFWAIQFFGRVTILGVFSALKVRYVMDGKQKKKAVIDEREKYC